MNSTVLAQTGTRGSTTTYDTLICACYLVLDVSGLLASLLFGLVLVLTACRVALLIGGAAILLGVS